MRPNTLHGMLKALPMIAVLFMAPAAWGATITYDFTFTCTFGPCSSTTTGSFGVDDAALAAASEGQFITIVELLIVDSVLGILTLADASAAPIARVGSGAEVDAVAVVLGDYLSGEWKAHLGNQYFRDDIIEGREAGVYVVERSSPGPAPVPEPSAAVLFSAGGLLVAHRCRRRPQH